MRGKILFIGHYANRTGASIVLLNFLKWLKSNTQEQFELIVGRGKGLIEDYEAICPTTHLGLDAESLYEKIIRKITGKTKLERLNLARFCNQKHIGLIYSNTIVNGDILELISKSNIPIISHIHEMELIWRLGKENAQKTVKYSKEFISASESVSKFLTDKLGVKSDKITKVYEFIEPVVLSDEDYKRKRIDVRKSLKVSDDDILVVSSGTVDLRKGADLFIQVASRALKRKKNLKFAWVGMYNDIWLQHLTAIDARNSGISESVRFLGEKTNPTDYFTAADIFLLTSREDPFPLVCLENASLGNPIICFEKSGSIPELVGDDGGCVVPYLDVEAMAAAVINLADDPILRRGRGENIRKRVLNNFTVDKQAPVIYDILKKYL
jgi:glycosyltransferase involved in cell wall biosynthesis